MVSLNEIVKGELTDQLEAAIQSCAQDIQENEDNANPRQANATIKLTPDEMGDIEVSYDVTVKLAKRQGGFRHITLGNRDEGYGRTAT